MIVRFPTMFLSSALLVAACSGSDVDGTAAQGLSPTDGAGAVPRPAFVMADLALLAPPPRAVAPDEVESPVAPTEAPHIQLMLLVPPPPGPDGSPCVVRRGDELGKEPPPPLPAPPAGAKEPVEPEAGDAASGPTLVQIAVFDHPPPPPPKGDLAKSEAPAKPPRPTAIATCLLAPGKDPRTSIPRETLDAVLGGEHPADAVAHVIVVPLPPPPKGMDGPPPPDGKGPPEGAPPPPDGAGAAPPPMPRVRGTMSVHRLSDLPR